MAMVVVMVMVGAVAMDGGCCGHPVVVTVLMGVQYYGGCFTVA